MKNQNILIFPRRGNLKTPSIKANKTLMHDVSNLEAFLVASHSIILCEGDNVVLHEFLNLALHQGYKFIGLLEDCAVIRCNDSHYTIHSSTLQIADYAVVVCRALTAEEQSNDARMRWLDARHYSTK